jgi:mRNA interferase MazF
MNSHNSFKQGDIFIYDFGAKEGSVQAGKRPVLILESTGFNQKSPTTIVAAITSVLKKTDMESHIFLGERFGLIKPSVLLLEQIQAVNKNGFEDYIGNIDDEYVWIQIKNALKKGFGLWTHNTRRIGEIICLCPMCLKGSFKNKGYILRRIDPLNRVKTPCSKCGLPGYDYMILDKKSVLTRKAKTSL